MKSLLLCLCFVSSLFAVNGVWYPTWRTVQTEVPPVPEHIDLVNVFVGELSETTGVSGLQSAFADDELFTSFIKACHGKNIAVMVSVGGHGGLYDNTWDQLTSSNISNYALALANYCKKYKLDGIDFDWEPDTYTEDQGQLVGQLIKAFKATSSLKTSLCTNSATSWQEQAGWVFKEADSSIDYLNIMAYYPLSLMQPYIKSWETWVQGYGMSKTGVVAGMLSSATDLGDFAAWDFDQGISTGLWFWDAGEIDSSNAATEVVWKAYHQ
ncbi:MAG: hypothetical protein SP1CHLAM54_03240 [Chlamydiia bacterium]|nr:hypothetical protein [Chlamydiia bacterium]MCH9615240.1 hypothetical protein [Chlamydiia bacterium]MCH9628438.1 hypothetical protein [Chlamydiia bacterium]